MFDNEFRQYVRETTGGSFDEITLDILNENGADPVLEGPQAQPTRYQVSYRDGVQEINGQWYTKYSVSDLDQEQRTAKDALEAQSCRDQRNKLLADCDWTQLPDATGNKAAWATYRQQLRDLPNQQGFPWDFIWPEQPK